TEPPWVLPSAVFSLLFFRTGRRYEEQVGKAFPKPCGAMDGGAERTGMYSQRVLERPSPPAHITEPDGKRI
ncbi:MAG: hypothetical protein LPK24_14215, partial [Marinobacter sp.]|uniref:hypothetical protein n=1 Tax=Marinobacter sp. TaxID=50741 RepID=UPI0029C5AF31